MFRRRVCPCDDGKRPLARTTFNACHEETHTPGGGHRGEEGEKPKREVKKLGHRRHS
jgi:hypothetical protein